MTYMEQSEILHIWHVCDEENVAIYAKFMQLCFVAKFILLQFTRFHVEKN